MSLDDLDAVLVIEREAYRFPWSGRVFKDCLRVGYSCWVLGEGRSLLGYGIMSVAAGESHILNLCVRPGAQRRGHGEQLLRHLCAAARAGRAETTLLEVRPSNAVAVRLYERHGFRRVGTRRGYYPDQRGREDAFVYALDLTSAPWLMREG
jgi:ribosomal-protein-alanine N-acetyltransferase